MTKTRAAVNKSLSILNLEGLLVETHDGWERCVKSLEKWRELSHYFYCEGDQEGWDEEKYGPDQVGCGENASWAFVSEKNDWEFFCSSCLLERVATGKVVSGEVTFFRNEES